MEMAETTEEVPCALISRTKTVTTVIFFLIPELSTLALDFFSFTLINVNNLSQKF